MSMRTEHRDRIAKEWNCCTLLLHTLLGVDFIRTAIEWDNEGSQAVRRCIYVCVCMRYACVKHCLCSCLMPHASSLMYDIVYMCVLTRLECRKSSMYGLKSCTWFWTPGMPLVFICISIRRTVSMPLVSLEKFTWSNIFFYSKICDRWVQMLR